MVLLPPFVKRIARAVLAIAGATAFVIGVWEAPGFITEQLSLLYAWGGETPVRIIITVSGIILVVVAIAGPARLQEWKGFVTGDQPGLSDEELKQQCLQLSQEIYEFLGDRRRDDPIYVDLFERSESQTEEVKQRIWARQRESILRYHNGTMIRYNQRYETRVVACVDELQERGLMGSEDRRRFEHPANELGIQEVARRLGAICRRL